MFLRSTFLTKIQFNTATFIYIYIHSYTHLPTNLYSNKYNIFTIYTLIYKPLPIGEVFIIVLRDPSSNISYVLINENQNKLTKLKHKIDIIKLKKIVNI